MSRTPRRKPACRLLGLRLLVLGAGLLAPGLVAAAPIRSAGELAEARHARDAAVNRAVHEDSAAHPGIFRSWSAYLMGGPSVWSTLVHPPVTQSVETAIWHALKTDPGDTARPAARGEGGRRPAEGSSASPWIEFLLWKRSLDEARFDHFHPKVSRALGKLSAPQTGTQGTTPAASNPGSGTSTPPVQGQQIQPNPVPEPGSFLVALGLAGWGLWWRRRARSGTPAG
jgi:hypothetical protein